MSNTISSALPASPYTSLAAQRDGPDGKYGSSSVPQTTVSTTADSVTLSDTAQFQALLQRSGLKVEGGTLGQLFSPAFFAGADANSDGLVSSSEFTTFIEQNGGSASQEAHLYQVMGGSDHGLSYDQFRQGAGLGDAKDFFNNLVMSRIKGSDSDPSMWMKRLAQLSDESDAASSKIAKELNG